MLRSTNPATCACGAKRNKHFEVPCGSRTRLASLEGWNLCRSAKGTYCIRRKEGESNSQGREARPGSSGVPSPIGLPFRTCRLQQEGSNLHPLLNRQVDYRYRILDRKSAQRESNPHFRHGKAAGCRYIMGANQRAELSKTAEHRAGVEPALPRYEGGVVAAGPPVRCSSSGTRGT